MKTLLLLLAAACLTAVYGHGGPETPEGLYRQSMLLETGRGGVARDTAASLALLRQSAGEGYAPAMNYLGYCYGTANLGLRHDPDSTLYWIERAATADVPDPKAFNNLGAILLNGEFGIKRDYAKARYWLQRGSDAGVATSAAMLAKVYLQGLGVGPDTVQALPLLRRAAGAGMHDAALELASIVLPATDTLTAAQALDWALPYYHERIFPVALPPIGRAAEAGVPLAVAILAQCTAEGMGVPYDYARAVELYARAAALGEPHAMFILAEALQSFPDLLDSDPGLIATLIGREQCDDTEVSLAGILYGRAAREGVTNATEALRPLRP